MNENMLYQQSIASELIAIKDRVRFFIKESHWGEDGRYKEVILMNYLKRVLPNSVKVGTGFVKNADGELTNQIDLIIYKSEIPPLFSQDDFVILMPESVIGIIEVKSTSTYEVFRKNKKVISVIEKCEENGRIIGSKDIFNGIFAYDNKINFDDRFRSTNFAKQLKAAKGYLNHISLGSNNFMRFWGDGNPMSTNNPCYSAYRLSYKKVTGILEDKPGFAYGYFISNLMETVIRMTAPYALNNQYFEFLYPLKETKEKYRIEKCEVRIDNT